MPRNNQGLYTLPAGNPVVPNTLIETTWANPTMDDIAQALTLSLPRDGSAPMTGPLTLANSVPTTSRHATSKAYVDQFISFASGMPVGGVMAYAGTVIPPGFFECNGQAINRVTYATLFAAIGVTYGAGDSSTTFNLPDMRDQFIRGVSPTRPIGNTQASQFGTHNHSLSDPGHVHGLTDPGHTHTASQVAHAHLVNDPGHVHNQTYGLTAGAYSNSDNGGGFLETNNVSTASSLTGVTIATAQPGVTVAAKVTGATVASAVTGIGTGVAGGDETRPQNIAQIYIIKAVQDSSGPATLTDITTNDPQMISVDNTLANAPKLVIHSNVAFGTVKLDASGQIPLGLLPSASQQLLGYWDASAGQTPSQASPSTNFASGDTFIISVTGLLTVFDPVTLTASPTTVGVGSLLQFIENSITNPTGWYYVVGSTTVVASQVGLSPVGSISATNVQAGFAELDTDKLSTSGGTITGDLTITAGKLSIEASISSELALSGGTGDGFLYCSAQAMGWYSYSAPLSPWSVELANGKATFAGVLVSNAQDNAINALTRKDYVDSLVVSNAFAKNKLVNGEVTRINQRAFDGDWTAKNMWDSGLSQSGRELTYGYDMWAKASATDMVQHIEAGNFRPSTVHTLSGTGVTTQQITSPASGNWAITVPQDARNVQVEEGAVATPFELRPTGYELAQCQRYFERCHAYLIGNVITGGSLGISVQYKATKRALPDWVTIADNSINIAAVGYGDLDSFSGVAVYASGISVGNSTMNVSFKASAVI